MKKSAGSLIAIVLFCAMGFAMKCHAWQLGPFIRVDGQNPVIKPKPNSTFHCPIQKKIVHWESDHTFNPAAVVHKGKVYLLYRAEDDFGQGIGAHTSRIGLAESADGIHFKRHSEPVLYPDNDAQYDFEWSGGCEDPRIVVSKDGTYIMTYTQWAGLTPKPPFNRQRMPLLAIATSTNLINWQKKGYAFAKSKLGPFASKSGSIVCRQIGDRLMTTTIHGKYWMYWGDGPIYGATSDDLINWEPIFDSNGLLLPLLDKRAGKFDSDLVEAGPPAIRRRDGILLLYNGKNSSHNGDPSIGPGAYAAGQVLFDQKDPTKVLKRLEGPFFKPEKEFEKTGQYKDGTVFIEGLVLFNNHWHLYYGTADSAVGMAIAKER